MIKTKTPSFQDADQNTLSTLSFKTETKTLKIDSRDVSRQRLKSRELQAWPLPLLLILPSSKIHESVESIWGSEPRLRFAVDTSAVRFFIRPTPVSMFSNCAAFARHFWRPLSCRLVTSCSFLSLINGRLRLLLINNISKTYYIMHISVASGT